MCKHLIPLHDAKGCIFRYWCSRDWRRTWTARCSKCKPKMPVVFGTSDRLGWMQNQDEMVCLYCPLAECDEAHPRCRYRQLRPRPEQVHYAAGRRCAACGEPITNGATLCRHCRRWRGIVNA